MTGTKRRILCLGAAHVLACSLFLWAYYPRPEGRELVVEGIPSEFKSCGSKSCDTGIRMGGVILSCSVDPLGISYSCAQFYATDISAKAVYFSMPTFLSSIGISNPTAVLLRFEQGGRLIREYEHGRIVSSYFIGAALPVLIFIISFLQFRKLRYFKKGN